MKLNFASSFLWSVLPSLIVGQDGAAQNCFMMGPNIGEALPDYVPTLVADGKFQKILLIEPDTQVEIGAWIKEGIGFCENVTQVFTVEKVSGTKKGGTKGASTFIGRNPTAKRKSGDGHPTSGVYVTFSCDDPDNDEQIISVQLALTNPKLDPITFKLEVACRDEGWSGFQTFCFTVFLVTTIFCVLGCGYNYVSRGLKGMEMIPCISYFRRCCAKITGSGEDPYTPQMDYDDQYGATYQTNL